MHLDKYEDEELQELLQSTGTGYKLLTVSTDLASCQRSLALSRSHPGHVHAAFGFHPEQPVPSEDELERLLDWIGRHAAEMAAVGEVGLPTFNRRTAEQEGRTFDMEPYVRLLERFVLLAKRLDKPLALHAVHEEAELACDLLEKHAYAKAHFHWYQGVPATTCRLMRLGCYISFTPELAYDSGQHELARIYPLDRILLETDGPWPYEGPFAGLATHPRMIEEAARTLAELRNLPVDRIREVVRGNALRLYGI